MTGGRSDGLNYYNIYNKDIGTDRIKVLFADGQYRRKVLIYIEIVLIILIHLDIFMHLSVWL